MSGIRRTTFVTDNSIVDADSRCSDRKTLGPEEFARSVRQLAVDTHHYLSRPTTTMCEFIRLRRRFSELVLENPDSPQTEIQRWLQSARQELEARFLAGMRNGFSMSRAYSR